MTEYVDPFNPATWPEFDPAEHEEQVRAIAHRHGFDWLEGEHVPSADDLMMEIERELRIVLPENGAALTKMRRFVLRHYRLGRAEVES